MRCMNGDLAATEFSGPALDVHVVMSYHFRNIGGISAADALGHVTAALERTIRDNFEDDDDPDEFEIELIEGSVHRSADRRPSPISTATQA